MDATTGSNTDEERKNKLREAFLLKRQGDFFPKKYPADVPLSFARRISNDYSLNFRNTNNSSGFRTQVGTPTPEESLAGPRNLSHKSSLSGIDIAGYLNKYDNTLLIPETSEDCITNVSSRLLKIPKLDFNSSRPGSATNRSIRSRPRVLYEGELMKYRPGISFKFMPRWCQLTTTEFKYFKSRWCANFSGDKPSDCVPLHQIYHVKRVKFHVSEKHSKFQKDNNFYQFEIFLYETDEMNRFSRFTDALHLPKQALMYTWAASSVKINLQDDSFMNRPARSESPIKLGTPQAISAWTDREAEWFASEKRLLFSATDRETANNWVKKIKAAKIEFRDALDL